MINQLLQRAVFPECSDIANPSDFLWLNLLSRAIQPHAHRQQKIPFTSYEKKKINETIASMEVLVYNLIKGAYLSAQHAL